MSDINDIEALVEACGRTFSALNVKWRDYKECYVCNAQLEIDEFRHDAACPVPAAEAALKRLEKHWEEVVNEALVAHREAGYAAAREQAVKMCEHEHDSQLAFARNLNGLNRTFAEEKALFSARSADRIRAMKPEGEE